LWSDGGPVGTLTVVRHPGARSFAPSEVQRLQAFAAQVSFVLDCVRAGLERRHRAVVEDEERIAGRLNDDVIGHLFRVGLTLHSIRQGPGTSPEAISRLDDAIEELDDAIRALRICVFAGTMTMP
jgi:GAF domain-containing protein